MRIALRRSAQHRTNQNVVLPSRKTVPGVKAMREGAMDGAQKTMGPTMPGAKFTIWGP